MIFWFSGTGNSQYAALKIAEKCSERAVSIKDCIKNNNFVFDIGKDENIGIVMPTYFYGVPRIITDFLEKLKLNGYYNNYFYALCTCGATNGNMSNMLKRKMKRLGYFLNASFKLIMPDNYILLFDLMPKKSDIPGILESAEKRIDEISEKIQRKSREYIHSGIGGFFMTFSGYPLYKYGRKTKHFYVKDSCIGCGLCEKVCPIETIRIINGKPAWEKGRCVQCLACLHNCPCESIQNKTRTEKRGRYVNPYLKHK